MRSHKKGHGKVTWGRRCKRTSVRTKKETQKQRCEETRRGVRGDTREHTKEDRHVWSHNRRRVWSKGWKKWRRHAEGDAVGFMEGDDLLEGSTLCWRRHP